MVNYGWKCISLLTLEHPSLWHTDGCSHLHLVLYSQLLHMRLNHKDCQEWCWLCLHPQKILWKIRILRRQSWAHNFDIWSTCCIFRCARPKSLSIGFPDSKIAWLLGSLFRWRRYSLRTHQLVFKLSCCCHSLHLYCVSLHEKRFSNIHEVGVVWSSLPLRFNYFCHISGNFSVSQW